MNIHTYVRVSTHAQATTKIVHPEATSSSTTYVSCLLHTQLQIATMLALGFERKLSCSKKIDRNVLTVRTCKVQCTPIHIRHRRQNARHFIGKYIQLIAHGKNIWRDMKYCT